MAIAEFNFGTLKYPWDDPRIADFQNNLDRVNSIAQRSEGFIWMLPEADMEAAQNDPKGPLADRPNTASTLSVWKDEASLYDFVHATLHARFLARASEWYVPNDRAHLVIWRCEEGHRPTIDEGLAHWKSLQVNGPTEHVFDGKTLVQLAKG